MMSLGVASVQGWAQRKALGRKARRDLDRSSTGRYNNKLKRFKCRTLQMRGAVTIGSQALKRAKANVAREVGRLVLLSRLS